MLPEHPCMRRQVHVYVGFDARKHMDNIPKSLMAAF